MGSGTGAGELIKLVLKNFDVLAGPMVTLVYPLYASIMEIENKTRSITAINNDQQWLTYWILHSMITLFELSFANLIQWIPIWSYVKFFFICWLVIPYFNGAALVYRHYMKPAFVNYKQGQSFDFVSRIPSWKDTKGVFGIRKQDDGNDILTAVEKYIKENGTENLEKLIHRVRADRNMHYGDTCYTDYTEDNTENAYYGNMCYGDYNTDYTEAYTGDTYYGNMQGYADYDEGNTCYGDTYIRDYDYNLEYTYRPFVD